MATGGDIPPKPEGSHSGPAPATGLPRWLVIGFVIKLLLVVMVTGAVLWWAGR